MLSSGKNIFKAFDECPFEELKVVIIGQDLIMVKNKQMDCVFL